MVLIDQDAAANVIVDEPHFQGGDGGSGRREVSATVTGALDNTSNKSIVLEQQ